MRIDGRGAWLGLLLMVAAFRLGAQQDSLDALVGKRIRITWLISPDRSTRIAGPLRRIVGDTLFVARDGQPGEVAVQRVRLLRFEVGYGRRSRTGHGAVMGTLIGAGTGVVSGLILCQVITSCDSSGGEFTGVAALVLGFGGALAGTGIGAIVGSFSHTDRWRPVRLGGPGGSSRGMEGIRLGLSIRF